MTVLIFKNITNKKQIIITAGDESGIGPEVILKALYYKKIPKNITIKLVGSKRNFESTYQNLKNIGITNIADPINFQIFDLEEPCYINKSKKSINLFYAIIIFLSTSSLMLLIPTNDKFDQREPTKSSQTINE